MHLFLIEDIDNTGGLEWKNDSINQLINQWANETNMIDEVVNDSKPNGKIKKYVNAFCHCKSESILVKCMQVDW